jgi:hypothetical protein
MRIYTFIRMSDARNTNAIRWVCAKLSWSCGLFCFVNIGG